ncbi:PucR family transcriptional regulator [Skermania piniformis]|uniref:PucR family transcriptional regulator n=1 Tax=Skermania pinensis TaxID=39122 RepID=A0ABX8SEQ6_9ACTN|nr:PucR family transcriptional regulator [Skermania piniformis]QXQ14161.1 PucR family transcriptional regulator [Skermania piniformis]
MSWEEPSEPVKELIRRAAEIALAAPPDWFDEIDTAAFAAPTIRQAADDPELRAFILRGTHSSLIHWVSANLRRPGVPVAPNTEEPVEAARVLARRGYDESNLEAYRLGQNVAWRRWMKIAFALKSDPDDLAEMLDVTARSISEFVDATIAATSEQIQQERELLSRHRDSELREMVTHILNGRKVSRSTAEQTLGYRLARTHTAVVVWTTVAAPRLTELERVADALARHVAARERLRIVAGPGTVWLWIADADDARLRDADRAIGAVVDVQIAIGSTGHGIDGFRVSHLDAVSTQQTMARLDTDHRVGTYADVEGVLLLTTDPDRANRFVAHTLGALEKAAPAVRETVRAYLHEQCNASRAADRLVSHRNTVLRRLKQADELLPRPLDQNTLNVAMALEIQYWRGGAAVGSAH